MKRVAGLQGWPFDFGQMRRDFPKDSTHGGIEHTHVECLGSRRSNQISKAFSIGRILFRFRFGSREKRLECAAELLGNEPESAAIPAERTFDFGGVGNMRGACAERLGRRGQESPAVSVALALELDRKDEHRQFGLAVGFERCVVALELQIVEVDFAVVTTGAGDLNNARLLALTQEWKQPGGKGKVREVICTQMQFKSVARDLAPEECKGGGVIDEQVDGTPNARSAKSEVGDRGLAL